jgi:hypothetical protein
MERAEQKIRWRIQCDFYTLKGKESVCEHTHTHAQFSCGGKKQIEEKYRRYIYIVVWTIS